MIEKFDPPLEITKDLQIAVTGHRRNRLSAENCHKIENQFSDLFSQLDQTASGQSVIVTGMADGADLAAVRALPKGWKTEGILARPVKSWAKVLSKISEQDAQTFAYVTKTGRLYTLGDDEPDYEEVGRRVLQYAHCLVAVWNGQPGLPGGTAHVVKMAKKIGLPIAIIQVPN